MKFVAVANIYMAKKYDILISYKVNQWEPYNSISDYLHEIINKKNYIMHKISSTILDIGHNISNNMP